MLSASSCVFLMLEVLSLTYSSFIVGEFYDVYGDNYDDSIDGTLKYQLNFKIIYLQLRITIFLINFIIVITLYSFTFNILKQICNNTLITYIDIWTYLYVFFRNVFVIIKLIYLNLCYQLFYAKLLIHFLH
jgi:hypothetical protein